MKKLMAITTAILGVILISNIYAEQVLKKSDIQGTWKMVTGRFGADAEMTAVPEDVNKLKLIADNHWTWIIYPSTNKQVQAVMGGTYTLSGNTYSETVDFVGNAGAPSEELKSYLGSVNDFTVSVEGDKFYLSGTMQNGIEIEEIWQRVK